MKNVGCALYPWPFGEFDIVMDDALNIAMDYLIRTGQAVKFREAQETAAHAISVAWRSGVRSRLRLSNLAIRAVEQNRSAVSFASMRVVGLGTAGSFSYCVHVNLRQASARAAPISATVQELEAL